MTIPDDGFDISTEHVFGDPDAPVTVVEYGDFECPYCAASAAEAAGAQGAYWQMHDLLFTKQDRLDDRSLKAYADHLGLDGGLVVGEAAQEFADKIEADFSAGLDEGVGGTPTLVIDGEPYAGRIEVAALRRATGGSGNGVLGGGGAGADGGVDPGARRQRRWSLGRG